MVKDGEKLPSQTFKFLLSQEFGSIFNQKENLIHISPFVFNQFKLDDDKNNRERYILGAVVYQNVGKNDLTLEFFRSRYTLLSENEDNLEYDIDIDSDLENIPSDNQGTRIPNRSPSRKMQKASRNITRLSKSANKMDDTKMFTFTSFKSKKTVKNEEPVIIYDFPQQPLS